MKTKITFLLFILPFFTFAQGPWEFNTAGNTESWIATQGSAGASGTLTATGTFIRYTTITGNSATARNPTFTNATANMNGNAFNSIQIRVKNGSRATYLRVIADGTSYYSIITESDIDDKTYTILLNRTGTIVSIAFEFRLYDGTTGGANYVPQSTLPTSVGTNIDIDHIRPFNVVTPTRNVFNFNTASDVEGFTTLTRATTIQATDGPNGTLKMTSSAVSALESKVALNAGTFTVDGTNKYAHVTLKNTSTNTRFVLIANGINYFPIQAYTISDATYKTYDFNLSTWADGNQQPEFGFSVQNTWLATSTYAVNDLVVFQNSTYRNTTGTNTATTPKLDPTNWVLQGTEGALLDITNSIYIDSIVFDNAAVVPTKFGNVYAAAKNKAVEVTWNTYNESNVKGYYVQRSNDGVRFNDLFFVTANNLQESKYDYTDRTISTDAIVYYRIKALDNDGTISFSSVVKINLKNTNSSAISLVNPVKSKTVQMQLNSLQKGNYQVKVQSLEGSVVLCKDLPIQNTSSSVSLLLPSTISKGFYILTVTGNEFRYASKIIIE
jgi:hypothetical protein